MLPIRSICTRASLILFQRNKLLVPELKKTSRRASFGYDIEYARSYLSPAYSCQDKWDNRLNDPFIKDVKPVDYYYELLLKYKKEGKVSAIDADIFLNSISGKNVEELAEEMEEVLRLLRRSPETINTLASTPHAIIKTLLEAQKVDFILKLICDPMSYGIFLDFYLAELLMNTYIKEKNYTAAARVAATLMLQEDFGSPLTQSLVLSSCFKYAFNSEENGPWVDFNPVVEPEEEVKIVVRYIRNPYFDDHFDLKVPGHTVGKTLAWLSLHMEDPTLKANAAALGWSLYEQWDQLIATLQSASKEKQQIDEAVFIKISSLVEACQDESFKSKLSILLAQLKNSNLVSKFDVMEKIDDHVIQCTKKYETENINNQNRIYDDWMRKRKEAVEKQLEMYERNRLLAEIESKKDDLQRREDVIFFFENKNKLDLLTPRKKKYYPKKLSLKFPKKKPRVVDTEYIPPEV